MSRGSRTTLEIVVVDANDARRHALRSLAAADGGVTITGEARNGSEALHLLATQDADAVVMGTAMPEMDGLTALRLLRASSDVPVVVLADELEVESMFDAVSLGASGYLSIADRGRWEADGLASFMEKLLSPDGGETISEIVNAPDGQRATLVTVPAGRLVGLAEILRSGGLPLRHAVYALLDAPPWLVQPLSRRLHRSSPWRVLSAREGDVLAPGHVLVATVEARLTPIPEMRRLRFARRGQWRSLSEAIVTISTARIAQPPGVHPLAPRLPSRAA